VPYLVKDRPEKKQMRPPLETEGRRAGSLELIVLNKKKKKRKNININGAEIEVV